jgi:hypothetical protein
MTLDSKIRVDIDATHSVTGDFTTPSATLDKTYQAILSSGTGAGQADRVFSDQRTLSASANEDLDLAGVLTDSFGATITFARIKGLLVAASSGNTNNVVVGAAASNPWTGLLTATGTVTLRPGAFFVAVAGTADATGYAVTAGTGDLLRVANSGAGTSVTYDIYVIGVSV